ncbi:MAG: M3 family metallopeptidase [Longimicrobiales bacterium]
MRFLGTIPFSPTRHFGFLLLSIMTLSACADSGPQASSVSGHENPLLAEWHTEFKVPPFDLIESGDYLPAFREAMEMEKAEIDAIITNPEPPTFANTIEALEQSGKMLTRVSRVFGAVNGAHTNDTLQETARTLAPERAGHSTDIILNADLWTRVKAVWDQRDELDLDPEQSKLLEETHKGFVRAGADLTGEAKVRMREINSEMAELTTQFGENVLNETNAYELHVTDTVDLGNLPPNLVSLAAEEARNRGHDSGWSFTLQRPSINPFLESSPNRELRRDLFMGYAMRANNDNENDNKEILARIAALRAEAAALRDYPTHAHYIISDNMAETPERVMDFLMQVWEPALEVAKQERDDMQALMNEEGVPGDLEAWDWRHYTERVRKARFDLDPQELLPYFEVGAVRDGVFMVANNLYGITFHQRDDLPRWHPDQQVFEVREADGSHLGVLYMDFFSRPSKRGGAWMNSLSKQGRLGEEAYPIVTTNLNFAAPSGGGPALITFDNAITLAHEMGHALHGLLSDVTYESLGGTSVARDFVEFGSQIMENWMGEPEVLRQYALHYQTGEPLPDEYIQKLQDSGTFNQGFVTVEYVAASLLDMAWHLLEEPVEHDANAFEAAEMNRIGLIEEIIPRYKSTYFNHIFSGGYSAGYYVYLWAEVLDKDAFQAFKETGDLFDRETGQRLRDEILSRGGTLPGMELFVNFRGREPGIEALLEARGLIAY